MSDNKPEENLHDAVASELLKRVKSGEATAADLAVAVRFLKDNGIQGTKKSSPDLAGLMNEIPMEFDTPLAS